MDASGRERRPSNGIARVLAPTALAITAVAAIAIAIGSLGGDSGSDGGATTTQAESGECNPKADAALENGFYVIKPGESLTTVAERTCMDSDEIETLNPNLDPQALPVGACVNLESDGCQNAAAPAAAVAHRGLLA